MTAREKTEKDLGNLGDWNSWGRLVCSELVRLSAIHELLVAKLDRLDATFHEFEKCSLLDRKDIRGEAEGHITQADREAKKRDNWRVALIASVVSAVFAVIVLVVELLIQGK